MKKRKMSAHINIEIAKKDRRFLKYYRKLFSYNCMVRKRRCREIFGPRLKQKRRMWLYLERIGKV